jgi:hypothetical protein
LRSVATTKHSAQRVTFSCWNTSRTRRIRLSRSEERSRKSKMPQWFPGVNRRRSEKSGSWVIRNRASRCAASQTSRSLPPLRLSSATVCKSWCRLAKIYSQTCQKVLVEFDLHQRCGVAGTGMSSSAEAAANEIVACTCSGFSVGKSARMSSTESPAARLAITVRRVTRVPRNTGSPPANLGVSHDLVFLVHRPKSLLDLGGSFKEHHTIGSKSACER